MYTKEELQEKGLHNYNAISGRFYLGLGNQLTLKSQGFSNPAWLTFYQAKMSGLKIKKGSKSIQIYYQATIPDLEFVDGKLIEKETSYRRIHKVFNVEQTEKALDSNQDNYVQN